jgi:LysM repeat protein
MDNNDSSTKPPQTGGLKLMTVFIAVLALHVVVIGGFTVYHLMSGGASDADLVTDKTHKDVKVSPDSATVSDGPLPDSASGDKTASTAPADTSGTPMTIPAPTPDAAAPTETSTPPAATTPAPAPAEQTASAVSGPIQTGPVITPPTPPPSATPPAATPDVATDSDNAEAVAPEMPVASGATYTVKAHDSLAKIAHRKHISVASLKAANGGLKNSALYIGEKLVIPASPKEEATNLAGLREPNTTLLGDSDFSELDKKPVKGSADDEPAAMPVTGGRHTYTVVKGDTLIRIARKFHTTSNAIMALNSISDARKLRLGQKLKIPSSEFRSANSVPAEPIHQEKIEPRATPSAQLANFLP